MQVLVENHGKLLHDLNHDGIKASLGDHLPEVSKSAFRVETHEVTRKACGLGHSVDHGSPEIPKKLHHTPTRVVVARRLGNERAGHETGVWRRR